jgi:hypothetical protein
LTTETYKKNIKPYKTAIKTGETQTINIIINAVSRVLNKKNEKPMI